MTTVEKIRDIEKEIARTQVNKATMSHLCSLRARLAKLRTALLDTPKAGGGAGEGFDVEKVGDGARGRLQRRCQGLAARMRVQKRRRCWWLRPHECCSRPSVGRRHGRRSRSLNRTRSLVRFAQVRRGDLC